MTHPLARLAGQLCARADFRAFCGSATADEAAAYIRRVCCIESRRELDHNPPGPRQVSHADPQAVCL